MKFVNTRNSNDLVSFKAATVKGLAPDGGLYFPTIMPQMSKEVILELYNSSLHDLATALMLPFVEGDMDKTTLENLLKEVLNFDFPLVQINENISSLELFHGPTKAFKDVGARFMSRCLGHFTDSSKKVRVLVATSGDTGSAVANGFWNVDGVEVVVLFPKDAVSPYQEYQMTSLGGNISAIEIEGSFDDCQALVKQAFLDEELNKIMNLSSANSINVARFLPQMLYYFFAYASLKDKSKELVYAVPSGNFGNLTAGLIAKKIGLPIDQFIAATNDNRVFVDYMKKGVYTPQKSKQTLSNAMDVGAPSNFERIMYLYNNNLNRLKKDVSSISINDRLTLETIKEVQKEHDYLLDPHGAVAYAGLRSLLQENQQGILLETAHPIKFEDAVNKAIPSLNLINEVDLSSCNKIGMKNEYEKFKTYLLETV